jgi:hypothetical protein
MRFSLDTRAEAVYSPRFFSSSPSFRFSFSFSNQLTDYYHSVYLFFQQRCLFGSNMIIDQLIGSEKLSFRFCNFGYRSYEGCYDTLFVCWARFGMDVHLLQGCKSRSNGWCTSMTCLSRGRVKEDRRKAKSGLGFVSLQTVLSISIV